MLRRLLLGTLVALIAGCGCGPAPKPIEYNTVHHEAVSPSVSSAAQNVTEAQAHMLFQGGDYYGMKNLARHSILKDDDHLQAEFIFNENVKTDEINSARSFVITKFVLWKESDFGGLPYDQLVKTNFPPQNVFCKIFIGDELLLQDSYIGNQPILYFENPSIPLIEQLITHPLTDSLAADMRGIVPKAEISFQKSLLGHCFVVNMQTATAVDEPQLNRLKDMLSEFAQNSLNGTDNTDTHPLGSYHGLVLRLLLPNQTAHEALYINLPTKACWTTDDWMNYNFMADLN